MLGGGVTNSIFLSTRPLNFQGLTCIYIYIYLFIYLHIYLYNITEILFNLRKTHDQLTSIPMWSWPEVPFWSQIKYLDDSCLH